MNLTTTVLNEDIQDRLAKYKSKSSYVKIAELLAFSLKNIPSELNRQIFGYIPSLFREIDVKDSSSGIQLSQLPIGEPVVLKINFPKQKTIKGIPFFYLFCYLKENSSRLNVYFQSAAKISNPLSQQQYTLANKKITFEGVISAFTEQESAICISDPGHFVPGLNSSFYVGTKQINFPSLISNVIESICNAAQINLKDAFLFGSSAGGMGALLTSTYFSKKVQVLAVNSQIITYDLSKVMKTFLETSDRHTLLKKFANRVSCLNRFQQNINSIPDIYLLANINDSLHHRNFKFYQLYQQLFVASGKENQSVFDSYCGAEGHGRPDKASLKKKMAIAKEILSMKSNLCEPLPSTTKPNLIEYNSRHQSSIELDLQPAIRLNCLAKSTQFNNSNNDRKTINKRQGNFIDSSKIAQLENSLLESQISQEQKINKNLASKKQLVLPNNLPQLDYQTKYLSLLNGADRISAADNLKLKSLNPQAYPKIGQTSADQSVLIGKQGWLFISSGTNSLMEYHTGQRRLPKAKINQWHKLLSQRIKWHKDQQIEYQHIFVPNKIAVYPEYYPHKLKVEGVRPILQLKQQCGELFTYPINLFSQKKEIYRLYEKQDSHWSFWGCYFAYSSICQKLKIVPNLEIINSPFVLNSFKGDLGNKFGLQETIPQKKLNLNSRVVYDNQVINNCHQGSVRILKNNAISQGKMIIFGDSFSNPGFPNYTKDKRLSARLSTLFAETLNEVHFVWTPWIDYDYIKREKPDFVLTQMAERFLVRVPNDFEHLPLDEFVRSQIEKYHHRS